MKHIVIERAKPEDAASLLDYLKIIGSETDNLTFGAEGLPLSVEAEMHYLAAQEHSPDHIQLLAKADGQIIGDASLSRKPRRMCHRGDLGISVQKAWWGHGIASALMQEIIVFAKEHNFKQLNLEVRSDNFRAIRLYEKYGFQKLCTFPAFFQIQGQDINFDLMNLQLTPNNSDSQAARSSALF